MSATAILRNTAVNKAPSPDLFVRLLNSAKENLTAFVHAVSELVTPATANESDLRKLYRLSHGGDSVTPQVLEALRKTQAAA